MILDELNGFNEVIEYYKLTKGNQDNERINNVTEQVSISFEGDFFECDFGNKENSLKVSYKYKKTNDSEYITGETIITPTIENNKYSFNGLIKGDTDNGFDIGSSYNIEVEVSDELSKVEYSYVIQAGIPAFAVFGNKMAIGDMYDESKSEYNVQLWNKILVNGIDFDNLLNKVGSVIITSSNESPSSMFGGEWELIDKEFDGTTVVSSKDNTYFSDTNANNFAISLPYFAIAPTLGATTATLVAKLDEMPIKQIPIIRLKTNFIIISQIKNFCILAFYLCFATYFSKLDLQNI